MIIYNICILNAYVIITAVSTSSYFVTFGTTSPINYFNVFVIDGQLFGWREIVLYCNAINVCRITSILYHKKYKLLSRIFLFMDVHRKLTILYWFAQSSLVLVFISYMSYLIFVYHWSKKKYVKATSDIFDICTYDWCQSLLGEMHYQNISSNRSLLATL